MNRPHPVPLLLDATEAASDPAPEHGFAAQAHRLLPELVRGGAALGWAEPPSLDEVAELLAPGARRRAPRGARRPGLDLERAPVTNMRPWTSPRQTVR